MLSAATGREGRTLPRPTACAPLSHACDTAGVSSVEVEPLLTAFALFEDGVELMAANLRRRHPDAADAEIERLLDAWLAERPGAEHGDAVGRPRRLQS